MYERFTDRARKAMQLANQEAQRRNCEVISAEDILVGVIKEGGGVAANVLKNLDVDLRKVRDAIETRTAGEHGASLGKRVIEIAMEESRRLQHGYVGTEHLLLGLLSEESSAANVLAKIGVTPETVRADVEMVVEQFRASLVSDANKVEEHPGKKLVHRGYTQLVSAVALADYDAVVAYAKELEQELANLKSAPPGTPLRRLEGVANYVTNRLLDSELSSKPPELTLMEDHARLAAEVAKLQDLIAKADIALAAATSWAGFTLDHWDNDRDAKVGKCLNALWGRLPRYAPDTDIIHAHRAEIAEYRKQQAALAARKDQP
jgi:HPt (histidine-containing phosphotransfer) domain-containing protein